MGIGEGINSDTQESKKKVPKNILRKFVKIEISVQIDSEGVTYIAKPWLITKNSMKGGLNMADYKLTLAEKETIILWSEADDTVQIDTFSQKLINRLRKAKERCPEFYRVDEPDRYGGVYAEVPKKLVQISFREPISEERREQYARLAKERFHGED